MFFGVGGSFFFCCASDFPNEDDGFGVGVFVEKFERVQVAGSINGVASDSDTGRLTVSFAGKLPNGFVGEGA